MGRGSTAISAGERSAASRLAAGLARGSSLNLFGWFCTKTLTFGITIVLVALLGKVGMGRYTQVFAILTVVELIALMPFGSGLTRMVAAHRADVSAVRGIIWAGVTLTALVSAILAAALYGASEWLAHHGLQDGALVQPLRLAAFALIPLAVADSLLFATMGFQRMRAYATVKLLAEPLVRFSAVTVAVTLGLGLAGAVMGLVVSSSAQAVLAWFALRRLIGPWHRGPRHYLIGQMCAFSLPMGLGNFMSMGLVWADSLILGAYGSSGDVGVYQVATRIVLLATFVIPAVSMAFAPRVTALTEQGDHRNLARAYRGVTTWTLRLSMPAFVVLTAFSTDLLRLFGTGFAAASSATLVLLVGASFNAFTGPGMQMLTMSGHPIWGAVNNGMGLVLNIGLNLVLIPRFGIIGAAWAWTAALIVMNLARLIQVHRFLDMWPFHRSQRHIVATALVAGIAAELVAHWVAWPARLVFGPLVVLAAYLPLTAREMGHTEWAALRDLMQGRR